VLFLIKKIITKKRLIIGLIIIAIITIASPILINIYIVAYSKKYILTQEQAIGTHPDCILVLGAQVFDDNTLSHMLEDRVLGAIELYNLKVSTKILLSGDHGRKTYDEVNAMKNYTLNKGVPPENIFLDHAGLSTYESMYRARDVFNVKKVIIVTQGFHLSRAVYLARSLGLDAYGVASDPRSYATMPQNKFREFFARVKGFFYCILKPKPTYLGEAIPISGDGRATYDKTN
jgi:SanA protein